MILCPAKMATSPVDRTKVTAFSRAHAFASLSLHARSGCAGYLWQALWCLPRHCMRIAWVHIPLARLGKLQSNAKVSNLDRFKVAAQEDVLRLDVIVHYVLAVDVDQSLGNLHSKTKLLLKQADSNRIQRCMLIFFIMMLLQHDADTGLLPHSTLYCF